MKTRQRPAPLGRRVGHRTGALGGREEVSCQVVYRVAAETNNNTLKKSADWLSGLASVNSTVDLSKQIFFQDFLFFCLLAKNDLQLWFSCLSLNIKRQQKYSTKKV